MKGPNIITNPKKYGAAMRRAATARRKLQAHLGRTRKQMRRGQGKAAREAYVWRKATTEARERLDPKEVPKKFSLRREGWLTD